MGENCYDDFEAHMDHWLYRRIPEHYPFEKNIEGPNKVARDNAKTVSMFLFGLGLLPYRVSATVEEGIFLLYEVGTRSLSIEAYNDGGVGWLVNDDEKKEIIQNADIEDFNSVNVYQSKLGDAVKVLRNE